MSHEQKLNFNQMDDECSYPSISPLAEMNRTRKILLLTIAVQLVLAVIAVSIAAYFYAFVGNFQLASFPMVLLSVLLLICLTFAFGLFATNRYRANDLLLFARLLLIDLIVLYFTLFFFVVIPAGREKYRTDGTVATGFFAMRYMLTFCVAAVLPAYTARYSCKLVKLLGGSDLVMCK